MANRIVILGANGFLGGWLYRRFSEETPGKILGFSSKECNLLSPASLKDALGDLGREDVVVMTAAVTRLKANNFEAMMDNIRMVENLSESLTAGQVVYLSSVDVYGCLEKNWTQRNIPIREDFAIAPDDYYGMGKFAGERILINRLRSRNMTVSILRLPGVFGACDGGQSLVSRFVRAAVSREKIFIYGDGQDRRDYLYVDDLYLAVRKAVEHRLQGAVNVVSGHSHSILDIVRIIEEAAQVSCNVIYKPVTEPTLERIKNMTFDNRQLREFLPGLEIHDLRRGIRQCLETMTCPRNSL